ncbi:MAG: ABC transporter ATP-binding protein [Flavitalea sp.]
MRISLTKCGKRFNRDWIFRNFSFEFLPGHSYAITGPNGSGKSTLLQVVGGALIASEGRITYYSGEQEVNIDNAFRQIAIAAPYLEVIEEMTLVEFLDFHAQFKPFLKGVGIKETIAVTGLTAAANKQIRYFSSGMKQRVKLIQAIFSDVSCVLLDEPCTNLDAQGIEVYQRLIADYAGNRTIVVSSNDIQEYGFCKEVLKISDWK